MRYFCILIYLLPIFGIFKKVSTFTFFLNKNNYQYYYNQLNNVERNIYNSIINNIDNVILENDFVYLNITTLIHSTKSCHTSEFSTYQNLYLIFEEQLNSFRNYFNNAKNAARYDYPELSFIDWDALDIDYHENGRLILVHKELVKYKGVFFKDSLNDTVPTSNGIYENTFTYLYKGLTNSTGKKRNSKDKITDYINEQTNFIYYEIIKNAFVDVPIVVGSDYYWTVSSFNNGINTIINNVINNIYSKVKSFDTEDITFNKNNITDYEFMDRNAEEVYGLFKSGYATSVNLAKTFKLAMDYIGIKCVLVWGKTTDNVKINKVERTEMWNAINIFDEWYSIDLAFNYYKVCKLNSDRKRGLKLNTFVDCQVDNDEEKSNKNNLIPYTLFGSELAKNYLIEDSSVFTSLDTYLLFPKLSQQNYELYMDIKNSGSQLNITMLNNVSFIDTFKNLNNIHTTSKEKEEKNNTKRSSSSNSKKDDMFVNINVKSVDFKMNNKDLIENIILSYDVFSEEFDVNTMSYLLVKTIQETSEYASNQYITFYMTSVPISYWYDIFGENFSIGKEGFEEVIENGKIIVKKYNDWSKFLKKYKNKFEILHESKQKFYDASPPLLQYGASINYKKSSPLPNYYINLKTTNVTICYNQPLIKSVEELSIHTKYSIFKPLLKDEKENVNFIINHLKFNEETNCIHFEFTPDSRISNIIYHFNIQGLQTNDYLTPVDFSYIIFPEKDYEQQRILYYHSIISDKIPSSKLSYSIPDSTVSNQIYYDGYNNIYYPNDVLLLSKKIKEETKEKMSKILMEKEAQYNSTKINTEYLTEITIKSTTGVTLKATSSLEILIPWTDNFKQYNFNTYKCYLFTIDSQGNPNTLNNCNFKFYSHGVITKIRSSQYIWIISYESQTNNQVTHKRHNIYYNTFIDIIKESKGEDDLTNSKSQEKGIHSNEFTVTNSSYSIINYDRDGVHHNYEDDICKTLNVIYNEKIDDMNQPTEKVVIDNKYNCYFNLKTKFKYYCHNIYTNEIITNKNGKCVFEGVKQKPNKNKIKKTKHVNKNKKGKNNTDKRDYFYSLDNGDLMLSSSEISDIDIIVPENALESTLVYFSVLPLEGYGVKDISVINKNTGEVIYSSTKDKRVIECIKINQSYRFVMPSTDIEISVEFAFNDLRVEYIIVDEYRLNIIEGCYLYYAVIKDKNDITEKPIIIKTENPYVTYNISYFILNEEIYITLIAPNNEYVSYTIRYISKDDFSDRSSVSMIYIDKKPIIEYKDNSYIFIYCNTNPSTVFNDIIDRVSIKELGTAKIISEIQGNKVLVNVIAENNYNSTLYTLVPLNKNDKEFSIYCPSSISDSNLNTDNDKNDSSNNMDDNKNTSLAFSIRSKYVNRG
ncbi:hypothetical protein PIROE2DRAFT_58817 [Piromyces sp. E2]|nr:hypothetical protein PIROE2DRAFT_58817 [Piromyces sp. E2]|eukprot:OUM67336.1 hypothetical protein PIROE2DRAFT_58817 [Piromyces sp. E2]